jgi:3-methyladenine DNA glycosylase AlkD
MSGVHGAKSSSRGQDLPLMAALALHNQEAQNAKFLRFLKTVRRDAFDERNFVRKAVSWSLRQIGKRKLELNRAAITTAKTIQKIDLRARGGSLQTLSAN